MDYSNFNFCQKVTAGVTSSPILPDEPDTTVKSPSPVKVKASKKRKCDVKSSNQKKPITRAVFTKLQQDALEERFRHQSFLSREERRDLAQALKLTDRQVMIWFQNRRGRLKKRGPQDKAYHPTKLQEINIRRPYPFLCGVLTSGFHQHQINGSKPLFSMYPREVQTHIKTIMPQLQEEEQTKVTQITATTSEEMEKSSLNSEHSGSPPLPVDELSEYHAPDYRNSTIPPPNVNMFEAKTTTHSRNTEEDKANLTFMQNNTCEQVSNFQESHWTFPNMYGSYQPISKSQFHQNNLMTCQSLSQGTGLQQTAPTSMCFSSGGEITRSTQCNYINTSNKFYGHDASEYFDNQAHTGYWRESDLFANYSASNGMVMQGNVSHYGSSKTTMSQTTSPQQNFDKSNFTQISSSYSQPSFLQNSYNCAASSLDNNTAPMLQQLCENEGQKDTWTTFGNQYQTTWQQQCTQSGYSAYHNALNNHGQTSISCSN